MRLHFWIFGALILFVTGCSQEPSIALPDEHEIRRGGNLYTATADLCGTVAMDEMERGRWRRWLNSDERIARAPQRRDPRWGTIVVIPPGTYKVPTDLCEDEWSWGWIFLRLLIVLGVAMVMSLGWYAYYLINLKSPPRWAI